jgi:phospholipid transport system substrate-binding protein
MKKILFLALFSFIVLFNTAQSYDSDPKTFIDELVNDALKILADKSLTEEDKKNRIEIIAKDNVDIKGIGLYVLGSARKSLSQESINDFNSVFELYFLKSLTSRLTDYSSQKFETLEAEQKSALYTIVKSKISGGKDIPEIIIDWRIYTKNPEKPLIRDLIVEGLSLARTQREEFSSILISNNNDIYLLIKKLEEFNSN